MLHNDPVLMLCFIFSEQPTGNRISLISKKNIRYEGTLYSINESNATVALQNVRSYGTEGREKTDASTTFVAPQDSVHPYLLFRGCDIKDLHVHESNSQPAPSDPAIVSANAPPGASEEIPPPPVPDSSQQSRPPSKQIEQKENRSRQQGGRGGPGRSDGGRGDSSGRRPRKPNPAHQVGTGASLLNRKTRGTVDGGKFVESRKSSNESFQLANVHRMTP
jgi:protein LSM14